MSSRENWRPAQTRLYLPQSTHLGRGWSWANQPMIFQYYAYAKRASQEPRKTVSRKFLDPQREEHWCGNEAGERGRCTSSHPPTNSETPLSGRRWQVPFAHSLISLFQLGRGGPETLSNGPLVVARELQEQHSSASALVKVPWKPLRMTEEVLHKACNHLLVFLPPPKKCKWIFFSSEKQKKKNQWMKNKLEIREFRNTFLRKLPVFQF